MTILYKVTLECESCDAWLEVVELNYTISEDEVRKLAANMDWGYVEGSDFCPECMVRMMEGE